MCFCPQYMEWKTRNENVIKSYANKKCCSWLHKKETVISNTVLYLISILTDRISWDEIYLRKVSLPWVTGERISVALQFLHPRAFLFLILVQRELFHGSWRFHCPGGAAPMLPPSLVQRVAWCLGMVEGSHQPAAFPTVMPGKGRRVFCFCKVGCMRGQPAESVCPETWLLPGSRWLQAPGCTCWCNFGASLSCTSAVPCRWGMEETWKASPLCLCWSLWSSYPALVWPSYLSLPFPRPREEVVRLTSALHLGYRSVCRGCARPGVPWLCPPDGSAEPGPAAPGPLSLGHRPVLPSSQPLRCGLRHALVTCCGHKHLSGFAFRVKCLGSPVWKVL